MIKQKNNDNNPLFSFNFSVYVALERNMKALIIIRVARVNVCVCVAARVSVIMSIQKMRQSGNFKKWKIQINEEHKTKEQLSRNKENAIAK